MRPLLLLLVLLFSLASCQEVERMEKPEDLIPREKMVDVLVELSLLQGARSSNITMFRQLGLDSGNYVWKRFNIDSLQFVESSNYYSENYDEYLDIYLEVQEKLAAMKVEYDSVREIKELKLDSLRAMDPEDSLERAREERFRDSILRLPIDPVTQLPEPVSISDSI